MFRVHSIGTTRVEGSSAPEPHVLTIAAMRNVWIGQAVSSLGDCLALFSVLTVLTFQRAMATEVLTGLQVAYLAPMALCSMFVGSLVDRLPVKATMITSDILRAALCLLLLHAYDVQTIYCILASLSIVSSFFVPAQISAIRSIVPTNSLTQANGLMQQINFVIRIAGPVLATLFILHFGSKTCYVLDALSFLVSATLLMATRFGPRTVCYDPQSSKSAIAGFRNGVTFCMRNQELRWSLIALTSAMFTVGCFGPLVAVYVRDVLHARVGLFGSTQIAIGFGLVCGSQMAILGPSYLSKQRITLYGLFGTAISLCILGLFTKILITLAVSCILGISIACIVVTCTTALQSSAPQHLIGRVSASYISLGMMAQVVGLTLSGEIAKYIGVRGVFFLSSMSLLALSLRFAPRASTYTPHEQSNSV